MKRYKGSFIAEEIMAEYREKKRWERYFKEQKRKGEQNANKESKAVVGSTENQERCTNKEAEQ